MVAILDVGSGKKQGVILLVIFKHNSDFQKEEVCLTCDRSVFFSGYSCFLPQ